MEHTRIQWGQPAQNWKRVRGLRTIKFTKTGNFFVKEGVLRNTVANLLVIRLNTSASGIFQSSGLFCYF